jgi:hypothetical protein
MHNRVLAIHALSACACAAGASAAAASLIADGPYLSHYQCYDTSGGRQPADDDRLLTDRFGSRIVDIDAPEFFCAGAQLRTATESDPLEGNDGADFTCYDIDGGQRPEAKVLVQNEFTGSTPAVLKVEHAKSLCVPTPRGTTSETVIPESAADSLDADEGFNLYYQCYSVAGGRQPRDDVRFVRDWLGPEPVSGDDPGRPIDVDEPVRLCSPANSDGGDRENLDGTAYLCNDIDGGQSPAYEHFFYNRLTLPRLDHMLLVEAESVCVPSTWQPASG